MALPLRDAGQYLERAFLRAGVCGNRAVQIAGRQAGARRRFSVPARGVGVPPIGRPGFALLVCA